jgi:FtsP/CotA-like multicopper oxidase with cupredoxin domain
LPDYCLAFTRIDCFKQPPAHRADVGDYLLRSTTMDRRKFIMQTSAGLLLPGILRAQNNHDMHHMMTPAPAHHDVALASTDGMPSGEILRPLWRLPNTSGEAHVFRATLQAKPTMLNLIAHKQTQAWCYAGKLPGPLIEVYEGDTVEMTFVNHLPQPSTIHWHGAPVPNDQDGGPMQLVPAGAQQTYRFTLPEGSAGTYWYHPHPHHMTAEQVFRGLAGTLIVRAKDDPLAALPETHLMFSDLKLDAEGTIAPNDMMDWMNGREGQFVLVNGQLRPMINVHAPQRWRLWNACSARYLDLSGVPMIQVGTDGGLLASPLAMTSLLLAPGERAEVIVMPPSGMQQTTLKARAYERGKMSMDHVKRHTEKDLPLADVALMGHGRFTVPAQLRPITPLGDVVVTRQVLFTEIMDMETMRMNPQTGRPEGMQFLINGKTFDHDRADFTGKIGDVELWEIINATDMDHPFHLHGTQFQVINRQIGFDVTPEPLLAWRDTVNVKPGQAVRIKVRFDLPGDWMFHCHILEHEDLGMMGIIRVV